MQSVPREWLDFLRQQFPKDSRIQLTEIGGNPRPISPGSTGKLDYIDDAGQFHVKWDNGCTLALVLGEDRFSVYLPEPQTFKLYMPLTADFYGRDEWGDMSEDGEEWDGHTLMDYEGQILSALVKNRVPEENESGLMRWYGEDDSVDHKVRSAVFTVEVRNRQLWGVAECRVAGELTPEELTILKEYLGGQASDGWGEGFEQRPIEVDGGELYVHLWQPDDWSIQTEQERFAPKVAEGLPELCFSTLRTTGQLICIKRGETGYYPSDWDTGDKEGNVELADELNEDLGVTPIQRQAMEIGSMAGWDVPGADPKHYDNDKTAVLNLPAADAGIWRAVEKVDAASVDECAFRCVDCLIPFLRDAINNAIDDEDGIEQADEFAKRLAQIEREWPESDMVKYKALLSVVDHPSLQDATRLMGEIDQYELRPEVAQTWGYAEMMFREKYSALPEELFQTPQAAQIGQKMLDDRLGVITEYGLIRRKDGQPLPVFQPEQEIGQGLEMM